MIFAEASAGPIRSLPGPLFDRSKNFARLALILPVLSSRLSASEVSGDHGSEGLKLFDSSPIARNSPLAAATHAVIRVRDTDIGIAAD
jgi:hypothetical protein